MSRPVKVLTILLWVVAVTGMVSVVAVQLWSRDRQAQADEQSVGEPIVAPDFALTDQLGRRVSNQDLRGHAWIADFIFTECESACPAMSHNLALLQARIPTDVKFVSFSVDPEHDTPPVLLTYAQQYGADNDRWRFLTGPKDTVMDAVHGMKVSIVPATQSSQIEHDIHFLLMDSSGRLHGVYDSRIQGELDKLVADSTALSAEESKP
jgi:protein SCO1